MRKLPRAELARAARGFGWGAITPALVFLGIDIFVFGTWLSILIQSLLTVLTVILWRWGHQEIEREKQRPDYSAIARMEREIWGVPFGHAGMPALPLPLGLPLPPASLSVRACCGTTPGTGHQGTCPKSLMNGGSEADIADERHYPIPSEADLALARHFMTALPFTCPKGHPRLRAYGQDAFCDACHERWNR